MKKKVLILGGSGLLGRALVAAFGADYNVVSPGRLEGDITNHEALRELVVRLNPAIVINATGHNGVDQTEQDENAFATAQKINGESVGNLARICSETGATFVHFSTDYVFDGRSQTGYRENAEPRPINKYGETKLLGEKLVQQNTDRFYLIRVSRLFGTPGTSATAKKSFVDIVLEAVEQKKLTEIKLVDEETSSPTYSVDAALFTKALIDTNQPFGIYHAANEGSTTWYGLGKKIFEIVGYPVKIIPVSAASFPRVATRPPFSKLLNTKFSQQRSWEDALKEYLSLRKRLTK